MFWWSMPLLCGWCKKYHSDNYEKVISTHPPYLAGFSRARSSWTDGRCSCLHRSRRRGWQEDSGWYPGCVGWFFCAHGHSSPHGHVCSWSMAVLQFLPDSGCRSSVCWRWSVQRNKHQTWQLAGGKFGVLSRLFVAVMICIAVTSEILSLNPGIPVAWCCAASERSDPCPDGSAGEIDEKHKGLKKG